MGRAGASLFISLSLKPGEKPADLSAALSHHERDFQPPPCPPKATHNLLRTPCKPCPPAQLIDGNAFPKKATILFYYGIFKKKEGKKKIKKDYNVQESRKGYTQQTRTPIFTIATSLFITWPTCIKEQPQEAKCKSSGTFKH